MTKITEELLNKLGFKINNEGHHVNAMGLTIDYDNAYFNTATGDYLTSQNELLNLLSHHTYNFVLAKSKKLPTDLLKELIAELTKYIGESTKWTSLDDIPIDDWFRIKSQQTATKIDAIGSTEVRINGNWYKIVRLCEMFQHSGDLKTWKDCTK